MLLVQNEIAYYEKCLTLQDILTHNSASKCVMGNNTHLELVFTFTVVEKV
jgi:hypothetical protein